MYVNQQYEVSFFIQNVKKIQLCLKIYFKMLLFGNICSKNFKFSIILELKNQMDCEFQQNIRITYIYDLFYKYLMPETRDG